LNSLFWRIFGSFWLLLIALTSVTLAINMVGMAQHSPSGPPMPPLLDRLEFGMGIPPSGPPPGSMMPMHAMPPHMPGYFGPGPARPGPDPGSLVFDVGQALDTQGVQGVDKYFTLQERTRGASFYLFDQTGHLVSGKAPNAIIQNLAWQTLKTSRFQMTFDHSTMLHGTLITTANHNSYVLVDSMAPPPTDWAAIILRLLGAVTIASLICWWLTVQITQPLRILRAATHDVAAGNFSSRTEQKLNGRKDELGMLGRDFDQMAYKLESLVAAQVRLIADISHELRSPLARLTLASAIARRTAGENTCHSLNRVDHETERLNELIGQLTSLSQLEMGSAQPIRQSIDLLEQIESVISSAAFEASEKECTISLRSDQESELSIDGDPELVHRAVENVVRNAVRYTGRDTEIDFRVDTISTWGFVQLIVSDHGPGVPDAELDEIFNPFYRTSLARDRESGGVGLGLTIAKRAVLHHGGTISARNRTNHSGLVVTIVLPVLTPSRDPFYPNRSGTTTLM